LLLKKQKRLFLPSNFLRPWWDFLSWHSVTIYEPITVAVGMGTRIGGSDHNEIVELGIGQWPQILGISPPGQSEPCCREKGTGSPIHGAAYSALQVAELPPRDLWALLIHIPLILQGSCFQVGLSYTWWQDSIDSERNGLSLICVIYVLATAVNGEEQSPCWVLELL
jgi:hypothetical protein